MTALFLSLCARIKWRIHAIPRNFRNKKARFLNTGRYFTHSRILGCWYVSRVPGHMHRHKKTKNGFHGFPEPPPPGHIHRHKKTKNEIWPVLSWLRAVFLSSVRQKDGYHHVLVLEGSKFIHSYTRAFFYKQHKAKICQFWTNEFCKIFDKYDLRSAYEKWCYQEFWLLKDGASPPSLIKIAAFTLFL